MPVYKNPDFLRPPPSLAMVFARSGEQSFFSLPQWYDVLTRFGTPEDTEIRVYTDERPGSTIGVPLQVSGANGGYGLASLANFYSVEHGLIADSGADLDRGLSAIMAEINAERPRWNSVTFAELDPNEASYRAWVRMLRETGLLVECTVGAGTWYEDAGSLSFAEYLATRPSQLRSTWRRKRNRLHAAGCLSKVFLSDSIGIDTAIADYETIYSASWKPAEPFPCFIPALIRLAARLGALRMGIYYVDSVPAAAQFWIIWCGRAVIYKLAHDRRFDELSPGTILTMEMIERALQHDRPYEINFGRGDDPYKRLWLPQRRERWGITAANPRTVRGLRLGIERGAAKIYHRMRGEPTRPRPLVM